MLHCIALLANLGNGKTTAAKYLQDTYGARIVSLATPLKKMAKKVMKFSDGQLYGTQAEKEKIDPRYGFSARTFLRLLGTEGLREEFWPNVHIEALMRTLEREENQEFDELLVVDDARFLNEAGYFGCPETHEHRTAVIKIVCADAPPVPRNHASESEIDRVPPEQIAATIVSSKGQGLNHLFAEIDKAFRDSPKLAPFRRLLQEGQERLSSQKGTVSALLP